MRFALEQAFHCIVPGCQWMVVAEPGDLRAAIRGYVERHARTDHRMSADEVKDLLTLMGVH